MKATPLYVALASLCQRYHNLHRQPELRREMEEHCEEEAHRLVKEHMPSGSGFDAGTELVIDNHYIMSPKDLCTIDFLDKFLGAGVRVL